MCAIKISFLSLINYICLIFVFIQALINHILKVGTPLGVHICNRMYAYIATTFRPTASPPTLYPKRTSYALESILVVHFLRPTAPQALFIRKRGGKASVQNLKQSNRLEKVGKAKTLYFKSMRHSQVRNDGYKDILLCDVFRFEVRNTYLHSGHDRMHVMYNMSYDLVNLNQIP